MDCWLSVFRSVVIGGLVSDLRSLEFGFEETTNLRATRQHSTALCPPPHEVAEIPYDTRMAAS